MSFDKDDQLERDGTYKPNTNVLSVDTITEVRLTAKQATAALTSYVRQHVRTADCYGHTRVYIGGEPIESLQGVVVEFKRAGE